MIGGSREGRRGTSGGCAAEPHPGLAGQVLDPCQEISDGYVLAALERAERHEGSDEVWLPILVEHLGLEPTPQTTRRLHPQLEYLRDIGSARRSERLGREHWGLTVDGREELALSREAEVVAELPESPQHRAWREARARAQAEIVGFRECLYAVLEEAQDAAAGRDRVASERWFELGERLRVALWLVGSATHCLGEWQEPDDRFPDVDPKPGPPPGRRAVSAWRAMAPKAQGGER